jgi:hypothetical protein
MDLKSLGTPKVLELVLELKQYPILTRQIRERMRQDILRRGIISPANFEQEVREKAIASQLREGLTDPLVEEPWDVWQQRLELIRDDLTDFYFAHNIPHWRFEQIVQETLKQRAPDREVVLSFNPELAPWAMLFALGQEYESYPPEERVRVQHHLREIVVVLTKGMISDQVDFVALAREFFTVADLKEIRRRRIGRGKIGGKAAGMMLAWKILQRVKAETDSEFCERVTIPDSYFIGADVFYDFLAHNDLFSYMNQKYKSREDIETDYPQIRDTYIDARFPDDVIERLHSLLDKVGNAPLVVRSWPTRAHRTRIWLHSRALSRPFMPAFSTPTRCSTGITWACWITTSGWPSCSKRWWAHPTTTTFSRRWPAWPLAATPFAGTRASAGRMAWYGWCGAWAPALWIVSPTTIRA